MSEITEFGTGERGIFKLDKPPEYKPTKINYEVLDKPVERGEWFWDKIKECLEVFTGPKKKETHFIWTDTIAPVESLATAEGKVFDSKSSLDRHYKEHGYERISKKELLSRKPPRREFNPKEHKDHWEKAEADVKYGNIELTEKEKEICKKENELLKKYKRGYRSDHLDKILNQN